MPNPSKQYASKESCIPHEGEGFNPSTLFYPSGCPGNAYWWSGFSRMQFVIENSWLKVKDSLFLSKYKYFVQMKNNSHTAPSLKIRQLPKPEYSGTGETILRSMLPIYMTLSMSQFITPMLMVVVDEKEKRIKESMKMVGLRDSVFW